MRRLMAAAICGVSLIALALPLTAEARFGAGGKMVLGTGVPTLTAPYPGSRVLLVVDGTLLRLLPDGTLDRAFGKRGSRSIGGLGVRDLAVDRHGRIVILGQPRPQSPERGGTLTRLRGNGSLDRSFGDGGTASVSLGGRSQLFASVAVGRDGRIVVAGVNAYSSSERGGGYEEPTVARLLSNGRPDPSFGRHGRISLPGFGGPLDIAFGPGRRLFVAMGSYGISAVVRLHRNGAVDRSFGRRGTVVVPYSVRGMGNFRAMPSIGVLRNGGLTLAGELMRLEKLRPRVRFAALRYTPRGRISRGFGRRGLATTAEFPGAAEAHAAAVRRDGSVLVVGEISPQNEFEKRDFAIGSLRGDGRRVRRLGPGGIRTVNFGGFDIANGVALQSRGRAVVAGARIRENPNGSVPLVVARTALIRLRASR
jgi:uncharacterized delta-60 repeat protein